MDYSLDKGKDLRRSFADDVAFPRDFTEVYLMSVSDYRLQEDSLEIYLSIVGIADTRNEEFELLLIAGWSHSACGYELELWCCQRQALG